LAGLAGRLHLGGERQVSGAVPQVELAATRSLGVVKPLLAEPIEAVPLDHRTANRLSNVRSQLSPQLRLGVQLPVALLIEATVADLHERREAGDRSKQLLPRRVLPRELRAAIRPAPEHLRDDAELSKRVPEHLLLAR